MGEQMVWIAWTYAYIETMYIVCDHLGSVGRPAILYG
jgi:hypothetical protein